MNTNDLLQTMTVEIDGIAIGEIEKLSFTKNVKDFDYSTYVLPKEINFTVDCVLFRKELGKLYYKKTHAKRKRYRKKYQKMYDAKFKELWEKYFG